MADPRCQKCTSLLRWTGRRYYCSKCKTYPDGVKAVPIRPATDEEVLEWAKRHDLSCWDHITEARAAFEDAETHHMTRTAGVTPTRGPLTKDEVDALVYQCRQAGDDSTYALVCAVEATHGVDLPDGAKR